MQAVKDIQNDPPAIGGIGYDDVDFGTLHSFAKALQEARGLPCSCKPRGTRTEDKIFGICFDHEPTGGHYEFVFDGPDAFELCRLLFSVGAGLPDVTICYGHVARNTICEIEGQPNWVFVGRYAQWDPKTEKVYEW